MANGNGAGATFEKMRDILLQIGRKFEKVSVRRTKAGPIDPLTLKLMLLERMFGGMQDVILEFLSWLNQCKFCYRQTAMEFFTTKGLATGEADFVLNFLVEAGFLYEYNLSSGEKIFGLDLGGDAALRAMGERSNFCILPVQEMEKLASLAFVRK
ncbi:hypothetical protein E308F_30990 [Moorella sp. E308F]|jgi:hypothetical protein|uniref:hypothetical protein n=1 Tax=Moorella sp. E308F TaxID=2572682 RepID=UPI0010FFBC21|nr:hypothetical protein [Moorella sp. E308F]GEA16853.1 hypothetical protein E308F_30990 [Moorella sp. E308F]